LGRWVAAGVTYMRNGFQGLAAKVVAALQEDPSYVTQGEYVVKNAACNEHQSRAVLGPQPADVLLIPAVFVQDLWVLPLRGATA
jgi:hypothetical protein